MNDPSAATSRENEKQTDHEPASGGELAAAPCSGLDNAAAAVFSDPNIGSNIVKNTTIEVKLSGSQKLFELLTSV